MNEDFCLGILDFGVASSINGLLGITRRPRPSRIKKAREEAMLPLMPQWQFHDLRRTARSLMSRAGVRSDLAERIMGHAIPGVEGVYDRHNYRDEKADALRRLAALIETVVRPTFCNFAIVMLPKGAH